MFDILLTKTSDDPTSDEPFERHPFPVVDFMFRNSGNGTALLTRYRIEVQNAEIDTTPCLVFDWALDSGGKVGPQWPPAQAASPPHAVGQITPPLPRAAATRAASKTIRRGNCLDVVGQNMGWGSAKDVNIELVSEALRDIVGPGPFHSPEIRDDSTVTIASLKATEKNQNMFQKHALTFVELISAFDDDRLIKNYRYLENFVTRREFTQLFNREFRNRFGQRLSASDVGRILERNHEIANFMTLNSKFIPLQNIRFNWVCIDVKGQPWRGKENLQIDTRGGNIWIGDSSFLYLPGPVLVGLAGPPGPMFCVIIEPERQKYIQEYHIARLIEAGGVERFQVLIGATKSCRVDIRIAFVVDGTQEVRSAPFHFEIENRRDQRFHLRYRDGQEILESVTERQERQARSMV